MLFLVAYAICNDSLFAFSAVTSQLFNLTVRPSIREFTAYNVAGSITTVLGSVVFMYVFPHFKITLRQWAMSSYALVIFSAFWCCLGMSDKVSIGFKHRAEFYVFQVGGVVSRGVLAELQVLVSLAGAILNPLFRVLFPEMFPKGNEIQYFGFQLVVSVKTMSKADRKVVMCHGMDPSSRQWADCRQDQQPAPPGGRRPRLLPHCPRPYLVVQ